MWHGRHREHWDKPKIRITCELVQALLLLMNKLDFGPSAPPGQKRLQAGGHRQPGVIRICSAMKPGHSCLSIVQK